MNPKILSLFAFVSVVSCEVSVNTESEHAPLTPGSKNAADAISNVTRETVCKITRGLLLRVPAIPINAEEMAGTVCTVLVPYFEKIGSILGTLSGVQIDQSSIPQGSQKDRNTFVAEKVTNGLVMRIASLFGAGTQNIATFMTPVLSTFVSFWAGSLGSTADSL